MSSHQDNAEAKKQTVAGQRKPYNQPQLQHYGDLRDVSKGNFAYAARENQIYTDFANSQ